MIGKFFKMLFKPLDWLGKALDRWCPVVKTDHFFNGDQKVCYYTTNTPIRLISGGVLTILVMGMWVFFLSILWIQDLGFWVIFCASLYVFNMIVPTISFYMLIKTSLYKWKGSVIRLDEDYALTAKMDAFCKRKKIPMVLIMQKQVDDRLIEIKSFGMTEGEKLFSRFTALWRRLFGDLPDSCSHYERHTKYCGRGYRTLYNSHVWSFTIDLGHASYCFRRLTNGGRPRYEWFGTVPKDDDLIEMMLLL